MDAGLSKAFSGVYNSSKEIIKNNQRHLFCNMLDLLARTTKTTGDKYLNTDEFILFWTSDILPLIFDEDKDIQRSAIAAMETVLLSLDFKILHCLSAWPAIKMKIVQNYSKEIPKYREVSNSCWYKIWSLLIRILDKEIVKGASTINAFLSVVELGFRSPDYNVRTEAFYCWKVLIDIFANNGELCSPKRIRLIYIPLKSSQSKTPQAAIVKLRVWWFLICKLENHIEQYVDTILETFLAFCYNSLVKGGGCGSVEFKEMSILCLISMLGGSKPKFVTKRMENFELNIMTEKNINQNILNKFYKPLTNYAMEALKDCNLIKASGGELSELLLQNLFVNVIAIESTEAISLLFKSLYSWQDRSVSHNMQKIVGTNQFSSCISSIQDDKFLTTTLAAVCKIVTTDDSQGQAVDDVIKTFFVFKAERFRQVVDGFVSQILANSLPTLKDGLVTWKLVTKSLLKQFCRSHKSECDSNLKTMNLWIMWPLKAYSECQNSTTEKIFEDQFEALLHMALDRLNNAINKPDFLKETSVLLQKMYNLNVIYSDLNAYFACFIRILVQASSTIEHDEELILGIFNILKINLARDFHKGNFELCLKCLKALVCYLGDKGLQKHFADIKDVWSHIINKKRSNHIEKTTLDDYKRQLLDDIRKTASKGQYSKIKNFLDNDDLFVIIPAVWSLNPDKLTERQKEKFYEKSDIPALYNDMSQSQDAFIKPWTPKKLVIAKGTAEEIVIGDGGGDDIEMNAVLPAAVASNTNDFNKEKSISPIKLIQPKEEHLVVTVNKTKSVSEGTPDKNLAPPKGIEEATIVPNSRLTRAKVLSIETEEIENNGHLDDYVEQVEAIMIKDTNSPPDRKQTNNSTSPVLKPKTTHLTGRGAQLINMIRNKKHDNYSSKQMETSTPVTKMEATRERTDSCFNWSTGDNDSKASPMNLLVFSKTLPSPCASPSASILKRKYHNESMEDIYDSQAFKRKRVSFHDPPVSITKEYLKDDENKNNSKRCLLLDQEQKSTTKHMLRRSAKMENQIQNENITDISGLNATPTSIKKVKCNLIKYEVNSSNDSPETNQSAAEKSAFPFLFRTETDVLSYVLKQFSIEDICEKYLSDEQSDKAGINFSRFISNYMNVSPKFKSTLLETLSEKHPKEFLDYAIQENLSSVVCDRLNSNTIIDYICSKSQTNISCRSRLFQEMQEILNHDKFDAEKCEFIQKVLTSKSMSDQQLLNLIELLFESKRKHQRAVSESAIDSSSTL